MSPVRPPGGDISSVILTVHYDSEQAVQQRLEAMVSAGDHLVEDLKTKSDLAHDNEKTELIYSLTSDHSPTLGERPSASIWLLEIIIES